jgi:hypothetical protein
MLFASVLAAFALAAAPETAAAQPAEGAAPAAAEVKTKKVCEKLPQDSTSRLRRSVCRMVKVEEKKPAAAAGGETGKTPG